MKKLNKREIKKELKRNKIWYWIGVIFFIIGFIGTYFDIKMVVILIEGTLFIIESAIETRYFNIIEEIGKRK